MFLKMLKNDLKGSVRYYLISLCILFVTALMIGVLVPVKNYAGEVGAFRGLFELVATLLVVTTLMVAFGLANLIHIFLFYHAKLFSREAYLTLTLPLSTKKNVLSKLVSVAIWCIILVIAAYLLMFMSIFIIALRFSVENHIPLSEFFADFGAISFPEIEHINFWEVIFYPLFICSSIASVFVGILVLMTFSQMKIFRNHKIVFIFALIGLWFGVSLFSSLIFGLSYLTDSGPIIITGTIDLNQLLAFFITLGVTFGGFYLSCYMIDHKIELV